MLSLLTSSFKIAINSLSVNKVRSFLTVLGIIIGVSSVILLVSIGRGLQNYITQTFEGLGTNLLIILPGKFDIKTGQGRAPGTNLPGSKFTLEDVKNLGRGSPYIEKAVPIVNNNAVAKLGNKEILTTITGTSADYAVVRNLVFEKGGFFNVGDEDALRRVAVLGATVAKDLFGEGAFLPLGQTMNIGGEHFNIIGFAKKRGGSIGGADQDNQVFIPVTVAQKKFGVDHPGVIYLKVSAKEDIPSAVRDGEKILEQRLRADDFTILNQADLLSTVNSILGVLTLALGGIAAISLLVGGIGIMNIMLVSVTERTKEIGLRKAVGARRNDILWQFLVEAVVLSSLGGALGIGLGFLGSLVLGRFLATSVTAWSVLLSFSVSALVGIIFGVFPAYKAAKLDPIEALRYE